MGAAREGETDADMANRLRHDLGKSIRLCAPEAPEADTEALRARLAADVLATRSGPGGVFTAHEVFEAWLSGGGRRLRDRPELADPLDRIAGALSELSRLARRLSELTRPELERADALTFVIASECRALAAAAREKRP